MKEQHRPRFSLSFLFLVHLINEFNYLNMSIYVSYKGKLIININRVDLKDDQKLSKIVFYKMQRMKLADFFVFFFLLCHRERTNFYSNSVNLYPRIRGLEFKELHCIH